MTKPRDYTSGADTETLAVRYAELKGDILEVVHDQENTRMRSAPMYRLNQIFNMKARRAGTTVRECIEQMHKDKEVFIYRDKRLKKHILHPKFHTMIKGSMDVTGVRSEDFEQEVLMRAVED